MRTRPAYVAGLRLAATHGSQASRMKAVRVGRRLFLRTRQPWVVRTVAGSVMQVITTDVIGERIALFGVWEPQITRVFTALLRTGDTVVDVGANIGYYSLLAAARTGPNGVVHAIEPGALASTLLEGNLRLNPRLQNVATHQVACSAEEGTVRLYRGPAGNLGHATIVPGINDFGWDDVEAKPLEAIVGIESLRDASLLKLDIEGAEHLCLNAIEEYVVPGKPDLAVLVEVSPEFGGRSAAEVYQRLVASGLTAYEVPNRYDLEYYSKWDAVRSSAQPRVIVEPPERQTDIFFVKGWHEEVVREMVP